MIPVNFVQYCVKSVQNCDFSVVLDDFNILLDGIETLNLKRLLTLRHNIS